MGSSLGDAAAYLARVVGSWDEVLVRVFVDGFVATMSVILLHSVFRVRWKPAERRQASVGAQVLQQKGFMTLLLNLPAILAADLLRLVTSFTRGFYLAPRDDGTRKS
jgi:hypothetical protein